MMINHYLMPPETASMMAVATGLDVLPINYNGFVVDVVASIIDKALFELQQSTLNPEAAVMCWHHCLFSQREDVRNKSPNFDTILNWYLNEESPPQEVSASIPCLQEHNKQYEIAIRKLEKEKRKGKAIEEEKKAEKNNNNIRFWWDESIDKMRLEELEEYGKGLMKLRLIVASRISNMMMTNHY
ncbi:hypothetical protein QYF36_022196 [Acer negundo]|nr:hypothetical protein QYF36_022196 [Acer negundo]